MQQAQGAAPREPRDLDVVVCDDERHIVRLIQVNLERQGYSVGTAFSGEECLRIVREKRPDMMVLDTLLGDMTGYQVATELETDPETAGIPTILLGDKSENPPGGNPPNLPPGIRCLYLTKPSNPMMFVSSLRDSGML